MAMIEFLNRSALDRVSRVFRQAYEWKLSSLGILPMLAALNNFDPKFVSPDRTVVE